MRLNALHNCTNPNQGDFKRVLAVCSAGLLRSPTIAFVLSQEPFNYNTRAAGTEDYALVPVDDVLLKWADEVVVVDEGKAKKIQAMGYDGRIVNLNLPDRFPYRSPELMELIKQGYIPE